MVNVLYLLNFAGKAGTERYVSTLVEKLNNNKIRAFLAYNEEGLLVDKLKTLGIETYRIVMRNRFDVRAAIELARLCNGLNIDIIHAQFLRENYIAMISRIFNPKVKVVYTNHFILKNDMITRFTNKLLTPLQAGIIAVCNRGREMMISNGINGSKIKVLFNAVDPKYWGTPEKSTLRSEFGIGGDVFVLLCASRFAYDKGHRYLMKSIARLKEITDRKFICFLAGDGPFLEEIKAFTVELGLGNEIIFLGFRSDIKNLYNGSDLYVNSSEHEASSFLIIEALASGLPVIATDMGGNSDIINDRNGCGMLVRYNDEEEMASAIKRVMDNGELRNTMKQNALKTVEEKFNLAKMANETYNLYKEYTGRKQKENVNDY